MNWLYELSKIEKWKKYSQCCEEAYIEKIFQNLNIKVSQSYIVELGAWDGYHLSNTRYFIELGAKALLIDGDNHGNSEVKQHFINVENVNQVLLMYNVPKNFDLLCIDLDGNDIYILDEILKIFSPSIIVAEFNPIFQKGESNAIRYNPNHIWNNDDYYGFSYSAGEKMANKNGYSVVFQNDSLNMYFVKNEVLCKSLQISQNNIEKHIPLVNYNVKNDHLKNELADWIEF